MMLVTFNEEVLRAKCEDVRPEEVGELITTLEQELNNLNRLGKGGIGLAAPQIGIHKKISIVRLGNGFNLDLVNARIEAGFDPTTFTNEGCLSFPGRNETTTRFQEVHIVDNLVYPHSFIATGLIAVVCQHELDHLNSTLFMDRAIPKVTTVVGNKKARPKDPCTCGSGKKYKKCCGK